MDGEALRLARAHAGAAIPNAGALLIVEADGDPSDLPRAIAALAAAARGAGLIELHTAADAREAETLWAARRALSPALRTISHDKINEDVVVPVSRLPELIDALRGIAQKHAIPIVNFGHAGNGNIHVNLLPRDAAELARAQTALPEVFRGVIALGGTLSGEHGIGLAKRDFLADALDPAALALMRRIKTQFDPDGILNPGKLLPPA
ncbi:MAG: FAD-binding oxidoreductase, partial [Xanthomonadaceae bacterium]|nr:FAD-binding oxidoreductase [Xanthomonadaceae bacterium]